MSEPSYESAKSGKAGDFHLCGHGWALYDRWAQACERKEPAAVISMHKRAYLAHRDGCEECTKPTAWRETDDRRKEVLSKV